MAIRLDMWEAIHSRVYLNGEEITNICDEAIPGEGENGLAVVYTKTPDGILVKCDCGKSVAQVVLVGQVTTTTQYPEANNP